MTLLTVVQDVSAVVGVSRPDSVIAAIGSNRTMFEMLSLAIEMAQRIAYDTRDWTALKTFGVLTGDGVTTGFPLPANYKRLLLASQLRRTNTPTQPMLFISDYDEWTERRMTNYLDSRGEWIIVGGNIHVAPTLPVGVNVGYNYLDKNCIGLASGGVGDRFMADNDVFRLDERILKLGMIWQWKANKGSPYAEDMGTYSDAIANAMGHDTPAPIIIGRRPLSVHGRDSYPWPAPS